MTDEDVVMRLIVPSGNAKSHAIEAIAAARKGEFERADELIGSAEQAINEAHECQSEMIRAVLNGEDDSPVSLVGVHGQDHLMNAITTIDLARQIVGLLRDQANRA